jgi:diguanylate cyclase (GGDEF)-like protein
MARRKDFAATLAVSAPATDDDGRPSVGQTMLIVMKGNNVGRIFELDPTAGITIIGREDECDIQVVDADVSRRHAAMRFDAEQKSFVVTDLKSRNGTFVNEEPMHDVRTLRIGDKLRLGTTTVMRLSLADEPEAHYAREMFRAALIDGLTGAYNRRYLDERLDEELAFAKRHDKPLSLILVDFDHFKRINDDYGHRAGDYVLRQAIRLINTEVRTEDVVARYGGEEFAVLCRDSNHMQAMVLAERLRKRIEHENFVHDGQTLPVTVSIGIADSSLLPDDSAASFIEAADQALYSAKDAGRNVVHVAPAPKPTSDSEAEP